MSTTTTATEELTSIPIQLSALSTSQSQSSPSALPNNDTSTSSPEDPSPEGGNITTAIPDGGYGYIVVLGCGIISFWFNGIIGSWGVLQTALLNSSLPQVSTSTISFVGSLAMACAVAFGLFTVRLMRLMGSRATATLGIFLIGAGQIASGFTTSSIGGMFGTSGLLYGFGMCMDYCVSNALPIQYFSGKLGLANGLIKLGGGLGATVLAVAIEAMIRKVGVEWTFRILGILILTTGVPAALLCKDRERQSLRAAPFIEPSMFKSLPFTAVFFAGAIAVFALSVPPFFLPLFAQSIGLSSSTGAALVAGFNLCTAVGRFIAGPLCDRLGPVNMFLITMLLNAVSMMAIWPFSSTLAPLIIFAMVNGVANGAVYTIMPMVVANMFGPGRAPVAMGMAITGWTAGYLAGAPIAGFLLQAAGGKTNDGAGQSINVYRPPIFYAGGVALASSLFVLAARLLMDRKVLKRV